MCRSMGREEKGKSQWGRREGRKTKSKSGTLDSLQVKKMSHLQIWEFYCSQAQFILLPFFFYFISLINNFGIIVTFSAADIYRKMGKKWLDFQIFTAVLKFD